jgi:hypothetical protein
MKINRLLALIIVLNVILGCSKDDDPVNLSAPIATAATDISNDLFVANWQAVSGANNYELHVATSADFSTDLMIIDNLPTTQTGVSSLQQNTEYYYKVRASTNGENESGFSNVISVTTLPDAPIANDATDITTSSFTANWDNVTGIDEYQVFVSTGTPPEFGGQILSGYNGISVIGNSLSIIDLQFNTVYYYQIKAVSEDRISEFSNSKSALTL